VPGPRFVAVAAVPAETGVHTYVNGGVVTPPIVTVAVPLLAPLQVTFVNELIAATPPGFAFTVIGSVFEQPTASVTVHVKDPAAKFEAVGVGPELPNGAQL
jgi:hypothetical protein